MVLAPNQSSRHNSATVSYHAKFDYPLTQIDLVRWRPGKKFPYRKYQSTISFREGFYFAKGKTQIKERLRREKYAEKKLKIAKEVGQFLKNFPTVKFVGLTGSLAMLNTTKNSDIDFLIITQANTLWLTRGLILVFLKLFGFNLRKSGEEEESDKLCFNLWMDEKDLVWRERNEYTAHELAQIIPLINKDHSFEKLLWKNKWLLDYWPNSVVIKKLANRNININGFIGILNLFAFKLQYHYMSKKITNEIVTSTRAQFHPLKISV